jgi:hypothetical protein
MEKNICHKTGLCPIFKKGILLSDRTGTAYKNIYCLKPDKYKTCKRYIVSEMTGRPVPENIMPNTGLSIEAIIERMGK